MVEHKGDDGRDPIKILVYRKNGEWETCLQAKTGPGNYSAKEIANAIKTMVNTLIDPGTVNLVKEPSDGR